MITSFKISSLMGEPSIKLENGITLDRMHGTVIVGKVENGQLLWIENFDNLPEKGKELLFKMLKARKVIMSFDVQFNVVTKGSDIILESPQQKLFRDSSDDPE